MLDEATLHDVLREAQPVLSLYFPLSPQQRDMAGPQARLRAALETAADALRRRGVQESACEAMLAPAREASAGQDFAHHRDHGFVLFASPDRARLLTLPHEMPDLLVVSHCAHIKPLLPALAGHRRFNVLALSAGRAELFTATPYAWDALPLNELPPRLDAKARDMESAEAATGRRLSTRTLAASPEDMRRELAAQDLRGVAYAVRRALADDAAPLVLAAEPQLGSQFRELAHLPQLQEAGLSLNPFAFSDRDLQAKVVALMRPALDAAVETVLEQVRARLGTAERSVGIRPEEILAASREGRVEAVVVALDQALWGRCDGALTAHGHQADFEDDLLNEAAVATLRAGGRAFALPIERLPRRAPAVATYRF